MCWGTKGESQGLVGSYQLPICCLHAGQSPKSRVTSKFQQSVKALCKGGGLGDPQGWGVKVEVEGQENLEPQRGEAHPGKHLGDG